MRPDPAGSQLPTARPHRRLSWRLLAAMSLSGVVALAGCAGAGTSGAPVSGTITIAAAPGVDDAPLWLAEQKGLFTAAGLHVKIIQVGSDAKELQAVESGQAQIAAADYGNIFYQQSLPHVDLRILADGYDAGTGTAEILVGRRYANAITLPQDLRTVTIGLPLDGKIQFSTATHATGHGSQAPPDSVSLLAAAATRQASAALGIGAADRLSWATESQTAEVAGLASGALKAALLTEPYIYQAESTLGATSIMDVFSGATAALPVTGYVAKATWANSNPAAVRDFLAAIRQAQTQAAMTGTVQQELTSLPKSAGFTTTVAKMVSIGTYPTTTDANALQRDRVLLETTGILPNS